MKSDLVPLVGVVQETVGTPANIRTERDQREEKKGTLPSTDPRDRELLPRPYQTPGF